MSTIAITAALYLAVTAWLLLPLLFGGKIAAWEENWWRYRVFWPFWLAFWVLMMAATPIVLVWQDFRKEK